MRLPRPRRIVAILLLVTILIYIPLEKFVADAECPVWLHETLSLESQRLTFQSDRGGSYSAYSMNADGTDVIAFTQHDVDETLLDSDTETTTTVLMSPDGVHAVLRDDGLWLADGNLTKQHLLVDPHARVTGYNWSRDGRFLAYATGVLNVIDVNSGQVRSLADIVGAIGVPQWSADSKYIVFDRFYVWGRDRREAGFQPLQIYLLDVNTFTPCLISKDWYSNDQNVNWLSESPKK